jgi:YegS/Rv2252/BmrU family lipid kinase
MTGLKMAVKMMRVKNSMNDIASPKEYLFIINPIAGRRHMTELVAGIEEVFTEAGLKEHYSVVLTDRGGHAVDLAKAFADKNGSAGLVIACGGDGTANEVANAVAGSQTAMTILPIGTANDFAHFALSGDDPLRLLPQITNALIRPIDVIDMDGKICLNITSFGFDTKVQRKASYLNKRYRWIGRFSYPLAVFLSIWRGREYEMEYTLQLRKEDGKQSTISGQIRYILAALCNGRYYGGGFNPAPEAKIDDGILDLCMVDTIPLIKIIGLIGRYKNGTHPGHPAISMYKVTAGSFKAPAGKMLVGNIDGELFEKEELEFAVKQSYLNFAFY